MMKEKFLWISFCSVVIVSLIIWLFFDLTIRSTISLDYFHQNESRKTEVAHQELPEVKVLFGGDVMLDRYIRTVMNRRGEDYPLVPLQAVLAENDRVVANLEGPITEHMSVSEGSAIGEKKNYVFTFAPGSASFLKRNHINIVNIGNNHILNFGKGGVQSTKNFLDTAGVRYFGDPLSEKRTLIETIHNTKIGFVNYNEFIAEGKERVMQDIQEVRGVVDILVVYAHWGKEYVGVPSSVRDLAHEFIEGGADVIIGSHPHIIQEKEVYQGKVIYYSLGNFIFDQYQDWSTRQGLLVKMKIHPTTHELRFEEIPIILNRTGQTEVKSKIIVEE
jgi:poly-gamma-glutamate synthesis protein (capsule biosynthesis protein)